jgi:hypothetical protein
MMKRRWKKMTDINDLLEDIEREYTVTEETIVNECNNDDCDCEDDKGSCDGCGGGCG